MDNTLKQPEIVINHATMRERWDMAAFLSACARCGLTRASIWDDEVKRTGIAGARSIMAENGIGAFGYNRAGPLIGATVEDNRQKQDAGRRALDRAAEVGADHVLVFSGGLAPGSRDMAGARAQMEDATAALLEHARPLGVKLALEPLHPMLAADRAVILSLSHANDICDRLGPGIGVVIDVYHVWWDERLEAEIMRTGAAGRILAFHVNDWLVPTRHILKDRGMMGDGVIDLGGIWRQIEAAGYRGPVEVEIFSERWWNEDPDLVLDTAIARCRELFVPAGART
ncbi:sugar phosphate isomerase/epimerase family protein [Mesorhizobium sp. L-8-3]|uniref:sugar phosphate isomerase/epimerase family protein n=1 Tax=Mesorhizobium sp. L-8-3 TaxID=2744522 RepID=UPI001927133D|nr:sugar phosphate isomerase/epimerase family protein [Mesorhizobium sp. L-8-3]BCH27212.1 endonuclease [Mesorhizobium sp. L-8-3]